MKLVDPCVANACEGKKADCMPDPFERMRAYCIATMRSLDQIAAEHALSTLQWFSLRLLVQEGRQSSSGLARRLQHDGGAMTRALDTLVNRTLVYRQRSIADRRIVDIELTDEGARIAAELEARLAALAERKPSLLRGPEITRPGAMLEASSMPPKADV